MKRHRRYPVLPPAYEVGVTSAKGALAVRVERWARTGGVLWLRGKHAEAALYDRLVKKGLTEAKRLGCLGAVERAAERGRERAETVHKKTGLYKKRGYSQHRRIRSDVRPSSGTTPVIFRVWKREGGVIAIFPTLRDRHGRLEMYEHNGGHGAGDPSIVTVTRLATPREYTSLKRELEGVPYHYRLRVVTRMTRRR